MKKAAHRKLLAMILMLAMTMSLVPALTIGAAAETDEQFNLTPGGTYYFDLSSKRNDMKYDSIAVINAALPDQSLKWVPFTYAGKVDAYSRSADGVSTDANVTVSPRSLFISDYAVSTNVSWDGLNDKGLIFGCSYNANGISYNLRSLSMGSAGNGLSGAAVRGTPLSNEWDQVLNKNSGYIKFQTEMFCWGQDTLSTGASQRVGRSWWDIRYFGNNPWDYRDADDGFRPALEVLNADTLGRNGLKTVTYTMGGNGNVGTGSLTQAAVVYTGALILPAVTEANGFYYKGIVPAGKTLGWLDGDGKFYAPGASLSSLASGTVLTAGVDVTVPTVSAISPGKGPLAGGTSVTITGTNFSWASAVHFGGTAASSFTVDSDTQITATAPVGSAGTVDVAVTTSGGTSATGSADQYTYVPAPTATTGEATAVTSTGATLNGTVNANNASTVVTFEYGAATSYGSTVIAAQSPVTGTSTTSAIGVLTGLTPNTTYHFSVKGTNDGGTTNGNDMTFTTKAIAPTATTIAATSVTSTGATLNGTVNANNADTEVIFKYGTTAENCDDAAGITAAPSAVTGTSATAVSCALTGLTPNTKYYYKVISANKAGMTNGSKMNFTTPAAQSYGDSTAAATGTSVEINGQKQDVGTSAKQMSNGKVQETIAIDAAKLDKLLESSGKVPKVTLRGSAGSAGVAGVLTGQTVKNMEQKDAVLEIKTDAVTYTLPAAQINIDSVSSQIGGQVALKDIKVNVRIAAPSADTVKVVENTASKGNFQLVVQPVEFQITCTSSGKTVEVSKFNGYVERTVAIPAGVDPKKITTGIVLNADGTFSHVPTQVTLMNGKYYAKIRSLTNSTYSVIWNPVTFTDVANHWAKDTVNDMGSRLVIAGTGSGTYEPDRRITRAEFAAIIVRAMGLTPGKTESPFKDVALTDWYNGYVDTATGYGLIAGCDSTAFAPNAAITREQAMAILAKAMKLTGLGGSLTDSEVNALLAQYIDGSSVSAYARTAAALCIKTGVVSGAGAATLSPKAAVTRAEVAVMMQRLLQKSALI